MYKKFYRCKMCKKIITEDLEKETYQGISIKMLNDEQFRKESIHMCNDKNIGILEFIGVRYLANHQ